MSAEPVQVEDRNDPGVILRDLPERERAEFLRQYHEAVDAAYKPAGYRQMQRLLHAWGLTVIATSRPGYYEELAPVQDGTAETRPAEQGFPGWAERLRRAGKSRVSREQLVCKAIGGCRCRGSRTGCAGAPVRGRSRRGCVRRAAVGMRCSGQRRVPRLATRRRPRYSRPAGGRTRVRLGSGCHSAIA